MKPQPFAILSMFTAILLCIGTFLLSGTPAKTQNTAPKTQIAPPKTQIAPPKTQNTVPKTQIVYVFKVGESYRYKVVGIFNGHFPPFAQPGSPAINIKAVLEYVATIKKSDDKGATIEFVADKIPNIIDTNKLLGWCVRW